MQNVGRYDALGSEGGVKYDDFIKTKVPAIHVAGFTPPLPINPQLFDWQAQIVTWALKIGRAALWEDCGLGKTAQQLEWARQVVEHTGKKVMILCPLAVAPQSVQQGVKFGIEAKHVHEPEDIGDAMIFITNYERLDKFVAYVESGRIIGIVLDESSILKNFSGKTTQWLIALFASIPYRLCCTATPSPNDYEELGNHAEFLGYGTRLDMLANFFIHDSANTADWRLKKHARKDFWKWIATWAACITKPSDIGYDDAGFNLPPLTIDCLQVAVDQTEQAHDELFRLPSMSGTEMHKEMRLTCSARVAKAAELVAASKGPILIWCNTNYEADAIKKAIPEATDVRGSDSETHKENAFNDFTDGKIRILISKPSIAGLGLNFQHCANHIFVGLSYSFEDFYQALRRGYRFGQTKPFRAYVVQAETEGAVKKAIMDKMSAHERMREEMKLAAKELTFKNTQKPVIMNTNIKSERSEMWQIFNGDCVRVIEQLAPESVGLSVYSPPFSSLYTYSDDPQDFGNNKGDDQFIEQYKYLIKEKFRITMPGRVSAVHCMDLPTSVMMHGYTGLRDFSGLIIKAHEDCGWTYHCRVTIWKDPVVAMQRTKAIGLLYKQLKKDSCKSRVGFPDYLLIFRKPGDNPEPVEHRPDEFPVDQWQQYASPVWMDICQTDVLNRDGAREQNDERHICPLQLDVIRRTLRLWSNKNDLVYSPFTGIGSEGYCAVEMGRRFVGSELKASYFNQAVQWLKKAERESVSQLQLV